MDIDRLLYQIGLIAEDVRGVTSSLNRVMASQTGEEAISGILGNAKDLTRNLNNVIVSNEAVLRAALENTRLLTGNLNQVVTKNDEKVSEVIDSLKAASREMEKTFAALSELTGSVNRGEGTLGQLLKDKSTADKLNKTLASLEEMTEKINEGRGTIGKLINDEETVKNLNDTPDRLEPLRQQSGAVPHLSRISGRISFREQRLLRVTSMYGSNPTKTNFISSDSSAIQGGSGPSRTIITNGSYVRTEEWDRNALLFNLQIGKRYRDLAFRGGLLESTGGFGIDYFALNDKLKFTFEAFDFTTDRPAHLKTGVEYQLLKHLYLTAGWDDFISNSGNQSVYGGFAIRFEDDDLKYLLTTTPIPK